MSCMEELAKTYAVKMVFIDNSDKANGKLYDQIFTCLEADKIPQDLAYEYNRYAPALVKTMLDENYQLFKSMLEQYSDAVKRGMVITSITGDLISDAKQVNIDQLASIGKNTSNPQTFIGKRFDFNDDTLCWESGGRSYEYDRESGLPILSAERLNCS